MQPHQLNRMFRENFRHRRLELGLSQQAVAERINALRGESQPKVHAPYISDLESGRKIPVLGTLAELAEALETTPSRLIALQPNLVTA